MDAKSVATETDAMVVGILRLGCQDLRGSCNCQTTGKRQFDRSLRFYRLVYEMTMVRYVRACLVRHRLVLGVIVGQCEGKPSCSMLVEMLSTELS